jgi:AhpD family alkylhydroperoxidase
MTRWQGWGRREQIEQLFYYDPQMAIEPHDAARPSSPAGKNSTARIRLLDEGQGGLVARLAYRESRRRYGQVMDPLKVMAHHPKILVGAAALELASERSKLVPARLKHLAELRAGMVAGCEWCLDFGSAISAEAGVSEDDLRELAAYEASERFNGLEKLVLDYATGMSRSPVEIPNQLFDELAVHLGEAQLVELTNIIALENYRARFNWAFGLEGQGFSEGSFCLGPELAGKLSSSGSEDGDDRGR